MKKKGFRFSFCTVVCLVALGHAAPVVGAEPLAGDGQPASTAGNADDHAEASRVQRERVIQTYLRARREALATKRKNPWSRETLTDSFLFSYRPAAVGLFRVATAPMPQPSATTATSGFVSLAASANYSTAGWTITSGDGTYPDLGGVATFNEQVGTTPGTIPAGAVSLDVAVSLSGLTFNSVYAYTFSAGTGGALSLTTTGTNTLSVPVSIVNSPTLNFLGDTITAPIGGGGTFGLTKTGAGTLTLNATNTYTGGTFITGGVLFAYAGDASLGATGAGNDVTLDGGTLGVAAALTTARNFTLNSGGGTLSLFAATSISGVIGGAGNLTVGKGSGLTLTGINTFTGSITLQSGSITLSGAGTLTTPSAFDLTGTLALSNAATNSSNRLSDTAPITSRGATISLTGNSTTGATTVEAAGAYTAAAGNSIITVTPSTGGVAAFNPASLSRSNNSMIFVRGTSLGNAAAASVAQINPATFASSNLIGGSGAAGSTTIPIIPWIIGNVSASAVNNSSLVTYTATGLRPLSLTTEYASTLTGATSTTNVRLTAAAAVPSTGATVNALVSSSTAATVLSSTSGGVLAINSGVLLYSPASNTATTISANLNFGTAEGIIATSNTTGTLTLSGVLAGSGGLTLNDFGNTTLPSGTASFAITGTANTYTGTTTLLNGLTTFTGTITNDGTTPSALGQATSAIVLNSGITGLRLWSNAAGAIINRDITVRGPGTGAAVLGTVGIGTVGDYLLTVNGNIALQRQLALEGGGTVATALTLNGVVSGVGYLTDSFSSFVALNGNNTYTGGTNIISGTYIAGSDTAFGTGTIYANYSSSTANSVTTYFGGTIQGSGTAARTIANPLVFANGTVPTFTFAGAAPLNFTGGVNLNGTTSLTFTNTAGTTFSGVVGSGGLVKAGAQTLTLSNANTYTGGTVVSAGALLVTNTTGSGTGAGAISVTAGTLGGTGFIVNTVPTGSTAATTTVASGAILQGGIGNTGALTLTGNLTLASGSIIQLGLGDGGIHSTLTRGGGVWVFASNEAFNFSTGGPVGFYDNIITGLAADPGNEGTWTINTAGYTGTFVYDNSGSTGSIDLTITASPVPEPATVLGGLLTAGLLGWKLRRRARRPAARS